MTTTQNSLNTEETIQLSPSYNIPIVLILLSIPLIWLQIWVSLIISLFGLFLMLQAVTIKLEFTTTALDIYRSQKLIRRFPYQEWSSSQIFWKKVPILFYFKEVKSIHFLPIIFDAKKLEMCLDKYSP